MKNIILAAFSLPAAISLSACVTWSKHGMSPLASGKIRIAVLPVQNGLDIRKIKNIMTVPVSPLGREDEKFMITQRLNKVEEDLSRNLVERLEKSGKFEVVPQTETLSALKELGISSETFKLSRTEAISLGNKLGSQAVLSVEIGGYGKVKRKWVFWLIVSGLPEAVAQGVVTAEVVGNQYAAIGVASEEMLQEVAMWGGGAYLFDRIFTPVVLDARLWSASDGALLWDDTSVGTINFKALRKLPKTERKKKEVRLYYTSEKTLDRLVRDIVKSAGKFSKSQFLYRF